MMDESNDGWEQPSMGKPETAGFERQGAPHDCIIDRRYKA